VKWKNQKRKMVKGTIVVFVENWGWTNITLSSLSLPTTLSCSYVPTPHKTFTSPLGSIFPLLCSHTAYLCRILILISLFCQMHGKILANTKILAILMFCLDGKRKWKENNHCMIDFEDGPLIMWRISQEPQWNLFSENPHINFMQ